MKKMLQALPLLLAALFLPLSSMAFEIGTTGYHWSPSLSGTLRANEADATGAIIDFDDDIWREDHDHLLVEFFFGTGKHHLSLIYTDIGYSCRKPLSSDIAFTAKTTSTKEPAWSTTDYTMLDLNYQYDLVDTDNVLAGFSLSGVFRVKYFDGEGGLEITELDESKAFTTARPMLGLNLRLRMVENILEARITGTRIAYSENSIYEALGELSWTPFPFLYIHGGYKTVASDFAKDDILLYYDISGPYAGLKVRF